MLNLLVSGGPLAGESLELIHSELRRLAGAAMLRERTDHTLQPTALVNEAYLRLTAGNLGDWESKAHFYGAAAHAMRQILIDHARKHNAQKRGGHHVVKVELNDTIGSQATDLEEMLGLDMALETLATVDSRAARVVELRYFAGLNFDEIAAVLGVAHKTVARDWQFARVWLERALRVSK